MGFKINTNELATIVPRVRILQQHPSPHLQKYLDYRRQYPNDHKHYLDVAPNPAISGELPERYLMLKGFAGSEAQEIMSRACEAQLIIREC